MQIELEKKYNLSENDYRIIKEKCEFVKEVTLKDYYLDKDYILVKNDYYLRLRNWKYELKICSFNPATKMVTGEEFEEENEINKQLEKFNMTIDDAIWVLFIDTKREEYIYNYEWYNLNIVVDKYQYWERYEIELVYAENNNLEDRNILEERLNNAIEDFIKEIWLTADSWTSSWKISICAMHQDIEYYEILTKTYF